MLKAIIINENTQSSQTLEQILNDIPNYTSLGTFADQQEALQAIHVLNPDVIFLNIESNGIALASKLSTDKYLLVFTTTNDHYALDALKLDASEYLIEPITKQEIEDIMPKLIKKQTMLNLYNVQCAPHGFVIQCFGSLTVTTPDQTIIKWPTRKVEELFAYFLLHFNKVVNKWRLADDLWPNKSINNIYNSVYLLNKTFKQYHFPLKIESINDSYRLQVMDDIMIDLIAFNALQENHLYQSTTLGLMSHVSNCGALYEGKDYPWVIPYREQLSMKHQQFLEIMLNHYRSQDTNVFNRLLADYARLYDDAEQEV